MFNKKQEAAIKALERLHARLDKLGLVMWAAVDELSVLREKDVERYMKEADEVSASDCVNYMEYNDLPNALIGYIGGVGD